MESNIYLGDCLDIMANIKSGSIDLVVTDPPYKLTQGGCKSQAINGHFKTQEKIATEYITVANVLTTSPLSLRLRSLPTTSQTFAVCVPGICKPYAPHWRLVPLAALCPCHYSPNEYHRQ